MRGKWNHDAGNKAMKASTQRARDKDKKEMDTKPWTGTSLKTHLANLLASDDMGDMPEIQISGGSTGKDKKLMQYWINDIGGEGQEQDIVKVKEYFTNLCRYWPDVASSVVDSYKKLIPQSTNQINLSIILPIRHYIDEALTNILARRAKKIISITDRKDSNNAISVGYPKLF